MLDLCSTITLKFEISLAFCANAANQLNEEILRALGDERNQVIQNPAQNTRSWSFTIK